MSHDNEDALAGIDLHTWQVPPPVGDWSSILMRAVAPVPTRRRLGWTLAAVAVSSAAIAAIIALAIGRPPAETSVAVRPAGPPVDEHVQQLLRELDEEHREIARRVAELEELRARIDQLAQQLRSFQERDKHNRPAPPPPRDPSPSDKNCDEVYCVLTNYNATCCAKFKSPHAAAPAVKPNPNSDLPEALDRMMISTGMAAIRARVNSCASQSPAAGKVKVRIQVNADGAVTNVSIETAPDSALGACVAAAVQQATFDKTQTGGSFSYPFVFQSGPSPLP